MLKIALLSAGIRGMKCMQAPWLVVYSKRAVLIQCTYIAMDLTILNIWLKIDVLQLLGEMKCPLRIVLCNESPYT